MKRIVLSLVTAIALFIASGCQQPTDPLSPGTLNVDVTSLSIDVSGVVRVQIGDSVALNYSQEPSNANSGLVWSSSDQSVVSVSNGTATAVGAGSAVITVASADDPSIKGECSVEVFNAIASFSGFTLFSQPDVGDGSTGSADSLYDDKLFLTNTSTDGKVNSSAFDKNTILHYDSSFAGDVRFQARILIQDQVDISSNRGVLLGYMSADGSGAFDGGSAVKYAFLMKRNRGDVRSYRYKADGTSRGAGSPNIAAPEVLDEYIYEVKRAYDAVAGETTITFGVYNSKDGSLIDESAQVVGVDVDPALADGAALFPAILANGATAVVSNIKIWSGAAGSETLEYDTNEIQGSVVPVTGVSVSGTERNSDGTYDYQNSLAGAQADTIAVAASVVPSLADDMTVSWSSSDDTVASVDASGNISVNGAGDVIITATTNDNGFTDTYALHITPTAVPVSSITVSGSSSLMQGLSTTLAADINPADATDQTVTWSSGDTNLATVDPSTGDVTASATEIGTVTITATANDGSGVTGTYDVTVTAAVSTIFSWIAGTDPDFDADSAPATVDGFTVVDRSGTTAGTSSGISLGNGRFNIGTSYNDNGSSGGTLGATSSTYMVPDGEFNFANAATVTLTYASSTGTGINVYVNNNTSSSGNSVLGSGSKISANEAFSATGGTATFSIDPSAYGDHASLANAFIQLRADSSSSITITSIMIAYD